MKLLLVHLAYKPDGEFQRVRKVSHEVASCFGRRMVEVLVMPVYPFSAVWRAFRRQPRIADRRIILPILLPRLGLHALRRLNDVLQFVAGWCLGKWIKPAEVLGETHGSWRVAQGVQSGWKRSRILIDLHGAFAEEMEYSHAPSSWRDSNIRVADRTEGEIVRRASMLICQSDAMIEHLEAKHARESSHMVPFQCGVEVRSFQWDGDARDAIRARLELPHDAMVFVYCGSLAPWQLVGDAMRAFASYQREMRGEGRFLVLTSERREAVHAMATEHGVSPADVVVCSVPHDEVAAYLSSADVAFLLRHDNTVNQVASPTKLGEYLSCGLPVIVYPVARKWGAYQRDDACFLVLPSDAPDRWGQLVVGFTQELAAIRGEVRARCRSVAEQCLSDDRDKVRLREFVAKAQGGL